MDGNDFGATGPATRQPQNLPTALTSAGPHFGAPRLVSPVAREQVYLEIMTKIYTKKGDKGKTTICGMEVSKNHPRLVVLGCLDELQSAIGVALSFASELKILSEIQEDLMEIEAAISVEYRPVSGKLKKKTAILEKEIDKIEKSLTPLKNFILPGGGKAGSLIHFSRAICRRAEQGMVTFSQKEKIQPEIIAYLNRLSDFLFALARWANKQDGMKEKIWS